MRKKKAHSTCNARLMGKIKGRNFNCHLCKEQSWVKWLKTYLFNKSPLTRVPTTAQERVTKLRHLERLWTDTGISGNTFLKKYYWGLTDTQHWFQVCNMILYLYTRQNGHHNKSSFLVTIYHLVTIRYYPSPQVGLCGIYVPQLYPFIHRWTLRLLPCLGYFK